jgi:hypothetical protein
MNMISEPAEEPNSGPAVSTPPILTLHLREVPAPAGKDSTNPLSFRTYFSMLLSFLSAASRFFNTCSEHELRIDIKSSVIVP